MGWGRRWLETFKYALGGILWTIAKERNFRVHILAAILVIILGLVFRITKLEWIFLSLTIFFVLVAEMINTAIEKTVDLITITYHPLAKVAKDVAAGAVLLAALNAVIVGIIIFGQRILDVLKL